MKNRRQNKHSLGRLFSYWSSTSDRIVRFTGCYIQTDMYFADEDGFGMEDNDEVEIYCVIDKDFNVLRPFRPVGDVRRLLFEVNNEREILK